jgi:hypothetical protein
VRCGETGATVDAYQGCPGTAESLIDADEFALGSFKMMDVIMLAIGLGFFVLSVGYCYACDRL